MDDQRIIDTDLHLHTGRRAGDDEKPAAQAQARAAEAREREIVASREKAREVGRER